MPLHRGAVTLPYIGVGFICLALFVYYVGLKMWL